MSFANLPLFGVLGGIAALAALLFLLQLLRIRHIEVTVPTTIFWQAAAREAPVRVLRGVFRHPLAYLLVLAIATLLWLAFAGPELAEDRAATYRVLYLDGSAHAASGDDFETAVEALRADIGGLAEGQREVDLGRCPQRDAAEGGRGPAAAGSASRRPGPGSGPLRAWPSSCACWQRPGWRPTPSSSSSTAGRRWNPACWRVSRKGVQREPRARLRRGRDEPGHCGARRRCRRVRALGPGGCPDPHRREPKPNGRRIPPSFCWTAKPCPKSACRHWAGTCSRCATFPPTDASSRPGSKPATTSSKTMLARLRLPRRDILRVALSRRRASCGPARHRRRSGSGGGCGRCVRGDPSGRARRIRPTCPP